VIIKPLHPKLAHAFDYRLSLSASVHSLTRPVISGVRRKFPRTGQVLSQSCDVTNQFWTTILGGPAACPWETFA